MLTQRVDATIKKAKITNLFFVCIWTLSPISSILICQFINWKLEG
jgi:hypothetical protein